ncbi:MAG: bifunctional riboflavin kinase/FAD synthetase [Cytophagaceae bacterium]|nr:bifunctional riboflavin kinase/FAD synthetase [Cytophagaceae bacterium]MDW8456542.1 bifunctional riboflavin kinase/FAD synthetase [Cytophagaceae bacterium]
MRIYHSPTEFKKLENATVTIGSYDGVHLAHQKILSRVHELSFKSKSESVVITFWPHPRIVLDRPPESIMLLTSLEEKIELISRLEIDHLLIIPFTRDFSEMSSDDFIKHILVDTIGTKKLVIGYDHRFGKDRKGSFDDLKKYSLMYDFEIEEIQKQMLDDVAISSTQIRQALLKGDVRKATEFLGRHYNLSGIVVKGLQKGRTIGFPTANIEVYSKEKLIPSDGVYAVKVRYQNSSLNGMMNIGYRPTLDGKAHTIEVHIFDFHKDIYGEKLEVLLVDFLRNEKKFNSVDELKNQLERDKACAHSILSQL